MTLELSVFISSKMQEFVQERRALHEFLPGLSNDFIKLRAWVFEDDATASDRSIREVYLNALKESALYIGLFWNEYGEWTIDEFNRATEWAIDRHIYVRNIETQKRDPRLQDFLDKQSDVISGITPKWYVTIDDLLDQVKRAIEVWLRDRLLRRPGDFSATLAEHEDDIPALPLRLIGRDATLQEIRSRLEEGGQVLLQGFGGAGKSSLAATVAADWLNDDRGNVLWLYAGSEPADVLFEAMARPFGAQQEIANAGDSEKTKTIRQLLRKSEITLLVLDDVWDGAALNMILKALPRRLPVLVTARHRYALEYIIEVGRLDPNAALDLLAYYAGRNFDDDSAASEVCRQLGYHAFALEVAGKTLKVDQIGPAELLDRIAQTPHAMEMPEDFAEEGRSSITELLAASLYALEEDVRKVFLAFGNLFAPNATPELLARYMAVDESRIQSALTILHRRGLADRIQRTSESLSVYRVHDLAYSYAKSLADNQEDVHKPIIQAICEYTLAHETDLNELDVEFNNILGAAELAHDTGDYEALLKLLGALVGPYLSARGHTLQFVAVLDDAISAAAQLGQDFDETRHLLLSKRGNVYYDRGDLENAARCYLEALELARTLNRPDREAILLCAIGKVRADQVTDDTIAYFEQAYDIAKSLNDGFLLAFVLEHQGYHAQSQGDFENARRYFAEEVALAEQIQDPETTFYALLNLGSAEHVLGEYAVALSHHEEALRLGRELDNRIWEAYALQSMGEDYHQLNDADQARKYLVEALSIFRSSGMQTKVAEVESYMGESGYSVP